MPRTLHTTNHSYCSYNAFLHDWWTPTTRSLPLVTTYNAHKVCGSLVAPRPSVSPTTCLSRPCPAHMIFFGEHASLLHIFKHSGPTIRFGSTSKSAELLSTRQIQMMPIPTIQQHASPTVAAFYPMVLWLVLTRFPHPPLAGTSSRPFGISSSADFIFLWRVNTSLYVATSCILFCQHIFPFSFA